MDPPASHTVEFNQTQISAAADYPRSAFHQEAPRFRIDHSVVDIGALESMQSASASAYAHAHASFPILVHRGGGIGRLSIR
jgi:uncharacterized protein (DUF736 family)